MDHGPNWRRWALVAAFAMVVVVAAGGVLALAWPEDSGLPKLPGVAAAPDPTQPPAKPVRFEVSPDDGARKVRLDAPAKVAVSDGKLREVTVTAGERELDGKLSADGTRWTSEGTLQPGTRYRVEAEAVDAAGKPARHTSTFTTLEPSGELETAIMPLDGETVGVGMPIAVWFSHPVAEERRADVERHLKVDSSKSPEGAWHWFSPKEVHYRPQEFWRAGERVTLHVDLAGVDAGGGVWGVEGRTIEFTVGERHVSVADAKTHKMRVTSGGKVVKTFPVSLGRDEFPTTNGVHFVFEKNPTKKMDSETIGIPRDSPNGYLVTTKWSLRISNSGEFVHSAPWSVDDQGSRNVSHGCINLAPEDAKWFFDFTRRGDVVTVKNSPKQPGLSLGVADWNMSWGRWTAGSALTG